MKIKLGITIGDPSGIGPEVTAKALSHPSIKNLAEFYVIGDRHSFLRSVRNKTQVLERDNLEFIDLRNVNKKKFRFGRVTAEYGRASLEYIKIASDLVRIRFVDCLVTAPVNKESINKSGSRFQGQTEYFANLFNINKFLMMLAAGNLRIGLISRHIPLKQVPHKIKKQAIIDGIILTSRTIKRFFGVKRPEIFVCGMNPHASDGNTIGSEELDIIGPAVRAASKKIKGVKGLFPADTAVSLASKTKGSGLVAMYHDQALIPLKLLGNRGGVNLTAGLPFVRTSPLHGTGFDIAGRHKADAGSMIEAIKTAVKCARILKRD